jgi:hypothetical protein
MACCALGVIAEASEVDELSRAVGRAPGRAPRSQVPHR